MNNRIEKIHEFGFENMDSLKEKNVYVIIVVQDFLIKK